MSTASASTRIALIETAERLFAERGIETVSLRDVCAEAGQRNHSAAQYHFGDRAGLLAAVFEQRMETVNGWRHAMLDALVEGPELELRTVVETLVCPLTRIVAETSGWYGRFLARTRWDLFAQAVLVDMEVLSGYRRAVALVSELLRDLPAAVRDSRIDQAESLVVGTIAGWEAQRYRGQRALPLATLEADLIATATAVLAAPPPG